LKKEPAMLRTSITPALLFLASSAFAQDQPSESETFPHLLAHAIQIVSEAVGEDCTITTTGTQAQGTIECPHYSGIITFTRSSNLQTTSSTILGVRVGSLQIPGPKPVSVPYTLAYALEPR
jgi:hypothetical protein